MIQKFQLAAHDKAQVAGLVYVEHWFEELLARVKR
jgi:hypothetical protein